MEQVGCRLVHFQGLGNLVPVGKMELVGSLVLERGGHGDAHDAHDAHGAHGTE